MASIGDHAIIGGGGLAALVGRDGSIDWFCWPRVDGPALLCRLLDERRGGFLSLAPEAPAASRRAYVPGTNVLETVFETPAGSVRCTDFTPWPRRPEDPAIARRLEALSGAPSVELRFRPTPDFAREEAGTDVRGTEAHVRWSAGDCRLVAPEALRPSAEGVVSGTVRLRAGETAWVFLTCAPADQTEDTPEPAALDRRLVDTIDAWRAWSSRSTWRGFARPLVERSALLLGLLTDERSGGIVAAPTTSLPEDPGGARNWDYRYTWLRDAALTVQALMRLGHHDEAMAYWSWLQDRGDGELQVVYRVDGGTDLSEVELDHLEGWAGSRPVRIGNDAFRQRQLDIYGEVLNAAEFCQRTMGMERDPAFRRMVIDLAERARTRWRLPDRGLWEVRGPRQHFLHSRLMCWVALDRAATLGRRLGLELVETWAGEAETIRSTILSEGYRAEFGCFTQAFGSRVIDASALEVPLVGLLPPDDPRVRSTLEVVRRELGTGCFLHRYREGDGLAGGEGAFLLCSFWLVDNLVQQGRLDEALQCFEAVTAAASDVGLLAEQYDPATATPLGNFPQALSHLGLIRSAVRIDEALRARAAP